MTDDAAALLGRLREHGWTLGVAESLTGGAVTSTLVSVPGASAVLSGGIVAYATMLKHTILGVDAALLDERGPVHPEVAEQMADGVRAAVRIGTRPADVGIATTGIAGPDSPDGQPVGTVHIGIATPAARYSRAFRFAGGRAEIRQQAVDAAIAEALAAVREYPHADAR